ncbi:MAG: hypothetical protein ABR508_01255 [Candidatus Baltobacteraceae bacterium]
MRAALAAAAAAVTLASCAQQHREAAATPPPGAVSEQYKKRVAQVGHHLEAQDRANAARHAAQMAAVIGARVLQIKDVDTGVAFLISVHNKTAKTIRSLGEGYEVRAGSKRIGLLEVDEARAKVRPHATVRFWQKEPYTRFGDEAGDMRQAQDRHKTATVKIIEVKYSDGSDAGYDD